jgi:hypothetical protein
VEFVVWIKEAPKLGKKAPMAKLGIFLALSPVDLSCNQKM